MRIAWCVRLSRWAARESSPIVSAEEFSEQSAERTTSTTRLGAGTRSSRLGSVSPVLAIDCRLLTRESAIMWAPAACSACRIAGWALITLVTQATSAPCSRHSSMIVRAFVSIRSV